MQKKITLLLVDDHQIVLDGLVNILEKVADFTIVSTTRNGHDAIKQIAIFQPDIVLLDIDMPIMNGIVVAEEVKKNNPFVKIIMLTLHQENSIIKHVISLGVDGYLMKNADQEELVHAIRKVYGGHKYFSSDVMIALSKNIVKKNGQVDRTNDATLVSQLTTREREIVILICDGFTNREIATQLSISSRTADAHRSNIMKKLDAKNVVGLVKFAIRNGLISTS